MITKHWLRLWLLSQIYDYDYDYDYSVLITIMITITMSKINDCCNEET